MKRPKSKATKKLSPRPRKAARLVERVPEIYLGPEARRALQRGSGLLGGLQRPGRVDVLEFRPAIERGYRHLIESRFGPSRDWDTVGVVMPAEQHGKHRGTLAKDLVPGDVVLVCSETDERPMAYVNLGDELSPARLKLTRRNSAT